MAARGSQAFVPWRGVNQDTSRNNGERYQLRSRAQSSWQRCPEHEILRFPGMDDRLGHLFGVGNRRWAYLRCRDQRMPVCWLEAYSSMPAPEPRIRGGHSAGSSHLRARWLAMVAGALVVLSE